MLPQSDPQLELFSQIQPAALPPVAPEPEPSKPKGPSRTKLIEASLISHLHPKTVVVWTDNKNTLLSQGTGKNKHHLRIHQMFMGASDEVIGKMWQHCGLKRPGGATQPEVSEDELANLEYASFYQTEEVTESCDCV